MDSLDLKLVSWNSRGFNEYKSKFLTEYFSDCTIICNQENFILRQNAYKIVNCVGENYHVFIKPTVKNSLDKGRPKGGLFICGLFTNPIINPHQT